MGPNKEYYDNHCVCPKCGRMSIEQTTSGCLGAIDTNQAICTNCGWKGIVDNLTPAWTDLTPKDYR